MSAITPKNNSHVTEKKMENDEMKKELFCISCLLGQYELTTRREREVLKKFFFYFIAQSRKVYIFIRKKSFEKILNIS